MRTKMIIAYVLCMLCTMYVSAHNTSHITPLGKNLKSAKVKINYSLAVLQKNVQYDFAKIRIRKAYYARLDELATVINDKKCAVALRGYADSIGTYKGNWVLSQKRADAVKAYLVSKGVSQELIVATAFGSTEPVASNKTVAGRQQNRRVEIKIKDIN
jgi:outer membrane protein OmpA-like peptidoglycan-associated protein